MNLANSEKLTELNFTNFDKRKKGEFQESGKVCEFREFGNFVEFGEFCEEWEFLDFRDFHENRF